MDQHRIITLREHQIKSVDAVFDYFANNAGTDEQGDPAKLNPLISLPCRSGKSLVIAAIIQRAMQMYPQTRVLMVTDVKELVVNNHCDLLALWPNAPVGILSAGLKRKDVHYPIIYGTLKTVVNYNLGYRDFLIVDEAQMVSDKEQAQYQQIIAQLKKYNPYLRVIGLSATNYRTGSGCLTNGSVFSDVVFNMCNIEGYAYLIAQGWLVPCISKRTVAFVDTSEVEIGFNGDFNKGQLEAVSDDEDLNYKILTETCAYGRDRRSWVVYVNGINDAETVNRMLNEQFGIRSTVVHSKMSETERDYRIAAHESGEYRCIVNNDILTKGWNNKLIDLIVMKRATISTNLWVQCATRGMTPAIGKANCLLLDFGRNTERLGPINDPLIPQPKGKRKGPSEIPVKICDSCNAYNHLAARICEVCGEPFAIIQKVRESASSVEVMRSDLPEIETFPVSHVTYAKHVAGAMLRANPNKSTNELPFSIKVAYYCGQQVFYEWITVESDKAFVRHKGHEWFRQRCHGLLPDTNEQLLAQCSYARVPSAVRVWANRKPYPQIVGVEWK
jgi:DNA repair protein RadD